MSDLKCENCGEIVPDSEALHVNADFVRLAGRGLRLDNSKGMAEFSDIISRAEKGATVKITVCQPCNHALTVAKGSWVNLMRSEANLYTSLASLHREQAHLERREASDVRKAVAGLESAIEKLQNDLAATRAQARAARAAEEDILQGGADTERVLADAQRVLTRVRYGASGPPAGPTQKTKPLKSSAGNRGLFQRLFGRWDS